MTKEKYRMVQEILNRINGMEGTISKMEKILEKGISGVTIFGNHGSGIRGGSKVEVHLEADDAIKSLLKEALAENRVELDKLYKEFQEA
jgi:hypothetical protein